MRLTAKQVATLKVVAAYEERYGKRCWAGREGTTTAVLEVLVSKGLCDRVRGEHGLRWWYGLTEAGRTELAARAKAIA